MFLPFCHYRTLTRKKQKFNLSTFKKYSYFQSYITVTIAVNYIGPKSHALTILITQIIIITKSISKTKKSLMVFNTGEGYLGLVTVFGGSKGGIGGAWLPIGLLGKAGNARSGC